jgi:hypothetical protein
VRGLHGTRYVRRRRRSRRLRNANCLPSAKLRHDGERVRNGDGQLRRLRHGADVHEQPLHRLHAESVSGERVRLGERRMRRDDRVRTLCDERNVPRRRVLLALDLRGTRVRVGERRVRRHAHVRDVRDERDLPQRNLLRAVELRNAKQELRHDKRHVRRHRELRNLRRGRSLLRGERLHGELHTSNVRYE